MNLSHTWVKQFLQNSDWKLHLGESVEFCHHVFSFNWQFSCQVLNSKFTPLSLGTKSEDMSSMHSTWFFNAFSKLQLSASSDKQEKRCERAKTKRHVTLLGNIIQNLQISTAWLLSGPRSCLSDQNPSPFNEDDDRSIRLCNRTRACDVLRNEDKRNHAFSPISCENFKSS